MSNGNTVTLSFGGKERRVRYDLNALAEIGDRLGIEVRLSDIGEDLLGRKLPLKALRVIFWAGFIHEDPELTEEEAGRWVDQYNFGEVLEVFFGLFGGIGGEPEPKPAPPKGKPRAKGGKPST